MAESSLMFLKLVVNELLFHNKFAHGIKH